MPARQSEPTRSSESSPFGGRSARWLAAAGWLLLVTAHGALLWLFDLAAHPVPTLVWLALGFVGLLFTSLRSTAVTGAALILLTATLLRALLIPLPPTLSDDLLRYLWDGKVANAGLDPYQLAPESAELAPLRDDRWQKLPHRDVATVYPPLSLALFSIAARSPQPEITLKVVLVLLDLLTCVLLLRLATGLGVPQRRVVWYAWNPLVVLEVAGMGHVDALGVTATVVVVWSLFRLPPRALAAAAAAAAGVLAKLVPLLAFPVWSRLSGRPARFLLVAVGLTAAGLAPVALLGGGVPPGLVKYGISWEFNGPLFEPLWRLLERVDATTAVKGWLDHLESWSGRHESLRPLYPFVYPQLMAKLLLLPGLLVAVVLAFRKSNPVPASGVVFSGVVLFSATVYPWYLLWTLPWAALCAQRAWLLLSVTILLSYLPQTLEIELFPLVHAAIWLPFVVAWWRWPRWSIA